MRWEKVRLGEVCEVIAGQSPPSSTYNNEGNGLPFFQGKADFGVHFPKVRMWCDTPNKIAFPDDILLSVRAPVGPTNICDTKSCIGRGLAAIRSGSSIHPKYAYYYFKHIEPKLSQQGTGSTFSAITTGVVKDLEIPLPPLPAQQKIAALLDAADAVRQKDKALLAKYDALLQSNFHHLFGDPVKNEKGWEVKKLGDTNSTIQIGPFGTQLHAEDYVDGGIPLINPMHIRASLICEDREFSITPEKANSLDNYRLLEGDIIMGRRGEMGRCALVTERENGWMCGTGSLFVRPNNINSVYLLLVLSSKEIKRELEKKAQGVTMANLNQSIIRNLQIPFPPLSLQTQFAQIAQNIQRQKALVKEAAAKSEALFQSLLHRVFAHP